MQDHVEGGAFVSPEGQLHKTEKIIKLRLGKQPAGKKVLLSWIWKTLPDDMQSSSPEVSEQTSGALSNRGRTPLRFSIRLYGLWKLKIS